MQRRHELEQELSIYWIRSCQPTRQLSSRVLAVLHAAAALRRRAAGLCAGCARRSLLPPPPLLGCSCLPLQNPCKELFHPVYQVHSVNQGSITKGPAWFLACASRLSQPAAPGDSWALLGGHAPCAHTMHTSCKASGIVIEGKHQQQATGHSAFVRCQRPYKPLLLPRQCELHTACGTRPDHSLDHGCRVLTPPPRITCRAPAACAR